MDLKKIDKLAQELQSGDMELLNRLSDMEREVVVKILRQWLEEGESDLLKGLWQRDYTRKPPNPLTFLLDKYYLGGYFDLARKAWIPEFEQVVSGSIVEWILTGGNSTGKSTISFMAILYKICEASCLRNPHEYYGLAPGSMIVGGLFNATLKQSKLVDLVNFHNIAHQSPYFRENFPAVLRDDGIFFPNNIRVIEGSKTLHALGLNIMWGILDEVSAYKHGATVEERGVAYNIYVELKSRLENRFIRRGRKIPGLLCLVSSADLTTSFLEEHLDRLKSHPELAYLTHKSAFAIWDMKEEGTYSGEKFRMLAGDGIESTRILSDEEVLTEENLHRLITPPIEHYHQALIDPDKFLQNSAGISTLPDRLLIPDRNAIGACIDPSLVHPFTVETLPLPVGCDYDIKDAFKYDLLFERRVGGYVICKCPSSPRAIHIDLASTECAAAFTVLHICRLKNIERVRPDGTLYSVMAPEIEMDLTLNIPSIEGMRTDLAKILDFILYLRGMGMPIRVVTLDRWNFEFAVQTLVKDGFTFFQKKLPNKISHSTAYAGHLSLERTDVPYVHTKQAILEGMIRYYDYPILLRELSHLKHDKKKKKVYFEGKGSKDSADTLSGAIYHALEDKGMHPVLNDPQTFAQIKSHPVSSTWNDLHDHSWVYKEYN